MLFPSILLRFFCEREGVRGHPLPGTERAFHKKATDRVTGKSMRVKRSLWLLEVDGCRAGGWICSGSKFVHRD